MKKITCLIACVVIFFGGGFTFMSCGEDDDKDSNDNYYMDIKENEELDYTLPASGSITVMDESGNNSYVRQIQDAGFLLWSSDYNEPANLSIKASFKNEGTASNDSFLSNHRKISEIRVSAYDLEKISLGKVAGSGHVWVNYFQSEGRGYYDWSSQNGSFSGDVSITQFESNKYITIKFTNCVFMAASSSLSPSPAATKGSFYGEIKFPLRNMQFFN